MLFNNYSQLLSRANNMGWKLLMLTGFSFILFGLFIVLVPEILVALIAGLFFFIGVTIMINGWHFRKQASLNQQTVRIRWFD